MASKIENDLEELSVNIFINEYGAIRSVYNRLYAIIHVYYSMKRQLVASEDTPPLEKILQMRKDIVMRLERVNALTKDEQFPQENFEVFAKEKLKKMRLAIGLLETASLMGELSSYSQTIMDYMRSCCEFAAKFITVLSDPGNQNLKALKNNLASLLEQIDVMIKQSQSSDYGRATVPLSETLSRGKGRTTVPLDETLSRGKGRTTVPLDETLFPLPQMEGVSRSPAGAHLNLDPSYSYVHKGYQTASRDNNSVYNVNEALNVLDKVHTVGSKSRDLEININNSENNNDKGVFLSFSDKMQDNVEETPSSLKFQEMLDKKYSLHSGSDA